MAQNFIACDRDQELLLPPSLREWLPEEHLAWFVLDAVTGMDLTAFHASYRDDGWGRAAHDPAMMVALFVYAYAIGVRSSRAIERRCHDDVAFRVITANRAPDHATIARFRVRHEAPIADLLARCLDCARAAAWSGSVSSRSTGRRSRRRRRITPRAVTSRSPARSSRTPRGLMRPRMSCSARRAATSCPRGCAPAETAARCCARPSRRSTSRAPRRPRRSRATAASGWLSAGAGCGRTGSSSATL